LPNKKKKKKKKKNLPLSSSPLSFFDFAFPNSDLTLNFARKPIGEWMMVDARTQVDAKTGSALAESRLYDSMGFFAIATQSLVVRAINRNL
jgi:hypothetical protein